jgi:hypothetical protein
MLHPVFGKLEWQADDNQWHTVHHFGTLAKYDVYYDGRSYADLEAEDADRPPEKPGVVEKGLDKVSQKVADWIEKDMSEYDEFDKENEEDDAAYAREEVIRKARYRQGVFPVVIEDPTQKGPSPEQEHAFREFVAKEADVVAAIMKGVFDQYCENRRGQPDWYKMFPEAKTVTDLRKMLRCTEIHISEYHFKGVAYIGLYFDCIWDSEHGLGVLWHQDHVVAVGDYDTVTDVPEADNFPAEEPLTPHQQLVEAVFGKDEAKIKQLVAEGADINALAGEYPPLHLAAVNLEYDMVKRFLELGADPNLKDDEGKTALQAMATFDKTMSLNQKSIIMRFMMRLAQWFNPEPFNKARRDTKRIMELLQAHGAK